MLYLLLQQYVALPLHPSKQIINYANVPWATLLTCKGVSIKTDNCQNVDEEKKSLLSFVLVIECFFWNSLNFLTNMLCVENDPVILKKISKCYQLLLISTFPFFFYIYFSIFLWNRSGSNILYFIFNSQALCKTLLELCPVDLEKIPNNHSVFSICLQLALIGKGYI